MQSDRSYYRGVAPAVGIPLLVAILVVLSILIAMLAFGLTEETDPQPTVVLEFEQTNNKATYELCHAGGEPLSGTRTELLGVADEDALHGSRFEAGEEVAVVPVADEVTLIWHGNNTDHVVQSFNVDSIPYDIGAADHECQWVENNINANGDLDMSDDGAICSVTDDTDTGTDDIDIDLSAGSVLIGDIDTDGDVNVAGSEVVGGVTTNADDITVTAESTIYGSTVAQPDTNADVDGETRVIGDVVVQDGDFSLNSATVVGPVYVDEDDFSCSNATIGPNGVGCSEYTPKDPDDYT